MREDLPAREDHRVYELGNAKLTLRRDLAFSPQASGESTYYVIEDPINSKYFRVGLAEYHFISLLDGKTTVREAVAKTADACGIDAFDVRTAATVCEWLIEMDLAHTDKSSSGSRLARAARTASRKKMTARLNPIYIRVPLLGPDRILSRLQVWFGWVFTLPAAAAGLLLMATGVTVVAGNWARFTASVEGIFSSHNYLFLVVSWLILKVAHEAGHGLACRKFGGFVREAGVMFILFLPIAFVDLSSAWRFRSKWQRIVTSAAGMYVELVMAAAAALVWNATENGIAHQLCANFILTASVTTILFNANPLMRFDGYYILSDLLEVPNLYSNGQRYMRYFGSRYLLGIPSQLPAWSPRVARITRVYAFAALWWRVVISASLVLGAATLFEGAGVVIAVMALVLWVGVPAGKFVKFLICGGKNSKPNIGRFILTAGGTTAAIAVLLLMVPWPFSRQAPAVVEYAPLTIVRAGSEGFMNELCVRGGQIVEEGQTLAVLDNPELQAELADLELTIERSRLKCIGYQNRHEMAEYQAELETIEGLSKQRAEKRAQVEKLTVRAPTRGKVVGRQLDTRLGAYFGQGDELFSIGDEDSKEVRAAVAQQDVDIFNGAVGSAVGVRISDMRKFEAELDRLAPRGSTSPIHPALCAVHGGPLPVKRLDPKDEQSSNSNEMLELLSPHFTATVSLGREQSRQVYAGQQASVRLKTHDESIGEHLYRLVSGWIKDRLRDP